MGGLGQCEGDIAKKILEFRERKDKDAAQAEAAQAEERRLAAQERILDKEFQIASLKAKLAPKGTYDHLSSPAPK